MTEVATLIAALASLIAAVTGCIVSLRNTRRIEQVHELTNSRMTQLVNEVRGGATDKATLAERAKVKAEAGEHLKGKPSCSTPY